MVDEVRRQDKGRNMTSRSGDADATDTVCAGFVKCSGVSECVVPDKDEDKEDDVTLHPI